MGEGARPEEWRGRTRRGTRTVFLLYNYEAMKILGLEYKWYNIHETYSTFQTTAALVSFPDAMITLLSALTPLLALEDEDLDLVNDPINHVIAGNSRRFAWNLFEQQFLLDNRLELHLDEFARIAPGFFAGELVEILVWLCKDNVEGIAMGLYLALLVLEPESEFIASDSEMEAAPLRWEEATYTRNLSASFGIVTLRRGKRNIPTRKASRHDKVRFCETSASISQSEPVKNSPTDLSLGNRDHETLAVRHAEMTTMRVMLLERKPRMVPSLEYVGWRHQALQDVSYMKQDSASSTSHCHFTRKLSANDIASYSAR
ncbi:hypothetical protein C8J56DRAFT_888908 [Mycena floridula]|nr:hypothetical protein C8J56DRAFT_888908 [Mycena floridula]